MSLREVKETSSHANLPNGVDIAAAILCQIAELLKVACLVAAAVQRFGIDLPVAASLHATLAAVRFVFSFQSNTLLQTLL